MTKGPAGDRSLPPRRHTSLAAPRSVVEEELSERIVKGTELLTLPRSPNELGTARSAYLTWNEFNIELLKRRFSTQEFAQEYAHGGPVHPRGTYDDPRVPHEEFGEEIRYRIRRLESLKERLSLIEEPMETIERSIRPGASAKLAVFIVHGHAQAWKEAVARFVAKVTDRPSVILHEQASEGRTIIEKFEEHAKSTGFAIVLLTGDDEGRPAGAESSNPRARQNVIFEMGFFIGALGRSRVAVLYEPGVELPSDISGVLYTVLDAGGAWQMELAREMRAAGVTVDLN